MTDFESERVEREAIEAEQRIRKIEETGLSDMLKHFDRIHDNLFSYNNLLIGGFFALAQFQENVSRWTTLIPVINLWFLIWVEYRMMEINRFQATFSTKNNSERTEFSRRINRTNLISLFSILTTVIVTVFFVYYIVFHA